MAKNLKVIDKYTQSNELIAEVNRLFIDALSVRHTSGVTDSLRQAHVRDLVDGGETEFIKLHNECKPEKDCEDKAEGCEYPLENACDIEDFAKKQREHSPFKSTANLLSTVKKYEFISLLENAYSQIGNKPFKLSPSKNPTLNDEQLSKVASEFYDYIDKYLEVNDIRVDEIPDAFDLSTLGELTTEMANAAQSDTESQIRKSIKHNEAILERVFHRSNFMGEYMEVVKDTADFPIGVLWVNDKALKKEKYVKGGKLAFKYSIQADAKRVDPRYFWVTSDFRLNEPGRAVFKLQQYTTGDVLRWKELAKSDAIMDNIDDYIESHSMGYRMPEAMLFNDHMSQPDGTYDVMVSRGKYNKESVAAFDIDIPKIYDKDTYVPCEIYFSAGRILRVRVMEYMDDNMGVYTTLFRRRGQGIFGYSLHEFIYPFAKLYAGAIDSIDKSVGKSTGSIIQVDTSVISDPEKYLRKNPDTGEVELDFTSDILIEFDSSELYNSPNFKGVPIHVTQLPSDLSQLIPLVEFTHQQLERISGIPNILVNGSNISSALRTTSNFNAAFAASAKVVQSLLRESELRVLKPAIQYIFDTKAMSGEMSDFLNDVEPEILLSDTLSRELNDDNERLQNLNQLMQYGNLIPPERLMMLINTVGREVYKLDEDLIPNMGAFSTPSESEQVMPV